MFGNFKTITYLRIIKKNMEDILNHYEQPVVTGEEVNETNELASEHLWNYLCGDGSVQHLYDYYECVEKN